MLSRNLAQTLDRALAFASERRHEYATLEHLLLALTGDNDAATVLRACCVDLDKLRSDLIAFLDKDLAGLATDQAGDPKPAAGFQRVVQRAAIRVQSAGQDEVTGANVLVALFGERESHAVYYLQSQDMTRLDAVNFISHGIAKAPGPAKAHPVEDAREGRPKQDSAIHPLIRHGSGLDQTIQRATAYASERKHEYATLEHLLLGLADDADAVPMLRACGVDLDRLRTDLTAFLDNDLAGLATDRPGKAEPTAAFQRVVQRAAIHARSAGRGEVTGANVLVAMFDERESQAVYFLQSQDMTRLDAVRLISHGIAKAPVRDRPAQAPQDTATQQPPGADPGGETDRTGLFKVLLFNDDFTPMEFVVDVLARVFGKTREEALAVMLEVHRKGAGVCGAFVHELAETKVGWAMDLARLSGHPMRCVIEKA